MPLTSAPTPSRVSLGGSALRILVGLLVAAMALTGMTVPAGAQTTTGGFRAFTERFSVNTTGDILQVGNALMTCPLSDSRCAGARENQNATRNNDFTMINIDIDGDPSTFNSSTADLSLPAGAQVLWAGLYWGADTRRGSRGADAVDAAARDVVQFRTPTTGYATLAATQLDSVGAGDITNAYQGFIEVTDLVRAAGSGTYGVANVQTGTGRDRYAGWALKVVIQDPARPARNLTVFDGFQEVGNGNPRQIDVDGFETPPSGPVTTRLSVLAWEGDFGITGDRMQLNNTDLSDGNNPATNFFNSSISNLGTTFTAKNPNFRNQFAVDLDRVAANDILANGDTSARIDLESTGDVYRPGVVTFATDLFAPNIVIEKTSRDLNGGELEPGDELEYTLAVSNPADPTGSDSAQDLILTDEIPAGTAIVPDSIVYVDGPLAGAKTTGPGDDEAEVESGVLTARLGTGATASAGGTLAVDASTTITFRVTVLDSVVNGQQIENAGTATFESTSGLPLEATSPVDDRLVRVSSDLSVVKTADPSTAVAPGGSITWTLEVRNTGPSADPAVVLTDELPTGVTVTNLPADCTQAGSTISCDIGALDANATATRQITATVTATGGVLTNSATVTGDNNDPRPGNNSTGPVTVPVAQAPTATDDDAATPAATPITIDVLANDDDPDGDNGNLTITDVTDPAGGTVSIVDGEIVYTPDPGFAGTDTFTYTVTDEQGLTSTATVTVEVANAPPVAQDDAFGLVEGETVTGDVTGNDTDPNGDDLTVTLLTPPANGTLTLNPDGTYTYVADLIPGADPQVIPDSFTYEISDGNGGTDTATVTIGITNQPPIAADDTAVTDPGTPVSIDVTANDAVTVAPITIDPAGFTIDPADGTVEVVDGEVVFTPAAGVSGPVTFEYTIQDGSGSPATATVTVTVANAPPVAVDDTADVPFNTPTPIDVLANDSDPNIGVDTNTDTLSVIGVSDVVGGTVAIVGGVPVFTPDPTFVGEGSFVYTISDGNGGTDTATVTVDVANAPPVAVDDAAATRADTPVRVFVLDNDTDSNSDTLTVTDVDAPGGGSATIADDGSVVVTPPPGFVGEYEVTYTISDGNGGTDTATITVTVTAPPFARDDTATVPGYGGAPAPDNTVLIDVLANDTDSDNDTLTVVDVGDPANGTVIDNGDGTVSYTPNEGFKGPDSFTYQISDGNGGTSTATVRVDVLNAPPVAADDSADTQEDEPVDIDLRAGDSDPNGDPLSYEIDTPPSGGTVTITPDGQAVYTPNPGFSGTDTFTYLVDDGDGGTDTATVTVVVNDTPEAVDDTALVQGYDDGDPATNVVIDVLANDTDSDTLTVTAASDPVGGSVVVNPDGTITYTPDPGFAGEDTFTYTVDDGNGGTDTATVTVTVNGPPIARDDAFALLEGETFTGDVTDNDTDPNGDDLTVTLLTPPTNGTLTLNPDGTYTYEADLIPGADPAVIPDSFTYEITDGNGRTDTATVTIGITNEPPIAADDTAFTDPATPVSIDVTANDVVTVAPITIDPTGFTIDPAIGTVEIEAGEVVFTPAPGVSGPVSFEYTIRDGSDSPATGTVTVVVANDPPVANDDEADVPFNTPTPIDVLANDTDTNTSFDSATDTLAVVGVADPVGGTVEIVDGTPVFTPDPTFVGEGSFSYTITDGNGGFDTATVTVNVQNAPPIAVDDVEATRANTSVEVFVLDNDTDSNSDTLTVTAVDAPDGGTAEITADGTVIITPPPGFVGEYVATYTIDDGNGGTDTAAITITVTAPPVAVDDTGLVQGYVGTPGPDNTVTVQLLDNDTDSDNDTLTVTDVEDPPNGTVTLNPDGSIDYTPDPGFFGTDTFTYTISDGTPGGTDTAIVTIQVNAPPVAVDDAESVASYTGSPGPANTVTVDVLDNDTDTDNDTLTVTAVGSPSNGAVVLNPDGTIDYTPDPAFVGTDTFTYEITDGNGGTSTATVTITVIGPPTAVDDAATVAGYSPGDPPTSVTIDVIDNDLDPAGGGLVITDVDDAGLAGSVEIVDGQLVYTPPPGFVGSETFAYEITDGNGNTATAEVTVTVGGLAPQAEDDRAVVDGYGGDGDPTSVTIDVLGNDDDPAGGGLEITDVDTTGSEGTVELIDGQLVYTPPPGFVGTDTFTYEITDINGNTSTATVVVEVEDLAPVAEDDEATVTAGGSVRIPVLDNDFDPNGGPISIVPDGFVGPDNGTVEIGPDGQLIYTPDEGFVGTDTFVYEITDGAGNTTTATVTVTVLEGDAQPGAEVVRVAGDTRIETAILVAQVAYPDGTPWVVLARSDDYADALSGATIARQLDAPILLTSTGQLDAATAEEITRLGAENALILGGEVAVSADTAGQVADLGLNVSRVGGVNRFDTARLVQANLDEPDGTTVYITEGENTDPLRGWPDALGVSSQAAFSQRPILLVNATRLPQETIDALAASDATDVVVVGGTAAVSAEVEQQIADLGFTIERIAGATRYETLALLYQEGLAIGLDPEVLWVATGLDWPDALTTGPVIGALGDTVALVNGQDPAGSPEILDLIEANSGPIETIRIVGGTNAVSEEVEAAIVAAANGDG